MSEKPKSKIGITFGTPDDIETDYANIARQRHVSDTEAMTAHTLEQYRLDLLPHLPRTDTQKKVAAREMLKIGVTKEFYASEAEAFETERQQRLAEKAQAEKASQQRTEEMSKFPNKYHRLCPYMMHVKDIQNEITKAEKTATDQELIVARERLLQDPNPRLNEQQKAFALSWLNAQIQKRQLKTTKKAEDSANLTRGLFGLKKS
jgi:hypothetical protein